MTEKANWTEIFVKKTHLNQTPYGIKFLDGSVATMTNISGYVLSARPVVSELTYGVTKFKDIKPGEWFGFSGENVIYMKFAVNSNFCGNVAIISTGNPAHHNWVGTMQDNDSRDIRRYFYSQYYKQHPI